MTQINTNAAFVTPNRPTGRVKATEFSDSSSLSAAGPTPADASAEAASVSSPTLHRANVMSQLLQVESAERSRFTLSTAQQALKGIDAQLDDVRQLVEEQTEDSQAKLDASLGVIDQQLREASFQGKPVFDGSTSVELDATLAADPNAASYTQTDAENILYVNNQKHEVQDPATGEFRLAKDSQFQITSNRGEALFRLEAGATPQDIADAANKFTSQTGVTVTVEERTYKLVWPQDGTVGVINFSTKAIDDLDAMVLDTSEYDLFPSQEGWDFQEHDLLHVGATEVKNEVKAEYGPSQQAVEKQPVPEETLGALNVLLNPVSTKTLGHPDTGFLSMLHSDEDHDFTNSPWHAHHIIDVAREQINTFAKFLGELISRIRMPLPELSYSSIKTAEAALEIALTESFLEAHEEILGREVIRPEDD